MAMKLDQEAVFKYVDKVFLAVALLFLAFTVVMLFVGKSDTGVSYTQVGGDLRRAGDDQKEAHIREFFKDQEQLASLSEEDRRVVELVQKTPFFAREIPLETAKRPQLKGKNFLEPVYYSRDFIGDHGGLVPPWATTDRPAPYKAVVLGGARERQKRYIPPFYNEQGEPRRIAPTQLLLVQDRGYSGTGKEPEEPGTDRFYVTGQFKADVGQQLEWCREYSPDAKALNSVLLTGYQVQRRELLSDGKWSDWKDIKTVHYENVKGSALVRRILDGDPAVLDMDPKKRKKFIDYVNKRLLPDFRSKQKEILRPPFFEMTDNDWLSSYEILEIDMEQEEEAKAAEIEADAAGIYDPLAAPDEPTESEKKRKVDVEELWFNDLIPITELGKAYQYRVRIKFFNPIFGASRDESLSKERFVVEVPGNWSEPSEPITVDPVVKFYFVGRAQTFGGGTKANIDLYRWIHGKWYAARAVQFEIGDPVTHVKRLPLEIPTKKGMVKMEVKTPLSFRANATVVDVLEASTMVSGMQQTANKLIYRSGRDDNRLVSRVDKKDRDLRGKFLKEIREREEKRKKVKRRTIRDKVPGPEIQPPEVDMREMLPPPGWEPEAPPPDAPPRRRTRR